MNTPSPKPEDKLTGTISTIRNMDLESMTGHVAEAGSRTGVMVSRETIESIKRTLYNAIDKLERMATE
jgi:hypothetical protein